MELYNNLNYEKETKSTIAIINNIENERNNLEKEIKINKNKFKPVQLDNILSNDICDFIINESEKYALKNTSLENPSGWTKKRPGHEKYPTTDLHINEIPLLKTLVNHLLYEKIYPEFEKHFQINKYFLDTSDLFIVKYESSKQNKLEKHKDGSVFSFNILLNDVSNFEGGGTLFHYDNNQKDLILNKKGSLIIHTGFIYHEGLVITKGVRYILVGFITYAKNEIAYIRKK